MMKDDEKDFYFGDHDPENVAYEVIEVSKRNLNEVQQINSS